MPRADVGVVGAGLAGLTAALAATNRAPTSTSWQPARPRPTGLQAASTPASRKVLGHHARRSIDSLRIPSIPTASWAPPSTKPSSGCAPSSPPRACSWSARSTIRFARCRPRSAQREWPPSSPMPRAAALPPWEPDETLVVCGPRWLPRFLAGVDRGQPPTARLLAWGDGPARIEAVTLDLPGLAARRNLSGLDLARAFDDPAWRERRARRASPTRSIAWRAVPAASPCRRCSGCRTTRPSCGRSPAAAARAVRGRARPAKRARNAPLRRAPRRRFGSVEDVSRSANPSTARSRGPVP